MRSNTSIGTYKVINDNLLPNYFIALEKLRRDVPNLKDYKFEVILGFNNSEWLSWQFTANSYFVFTNGTTQCFSTHVENEDLFELIAEHSSYLTTQEHIFHSLVDTLNKLVEETTRPDDFDNPFIAWLVREILKNGNICYEDFINIDDEETIANDELIETMSSILGIDIDSLGSYLQEYYSTFDGKYNLTG